MGQSTVDRFFGISDRGSTVSTEIRGGLLIFLATLHITVVNISMMGEAGMDQGEAFAAVVSLALLGSLFMGLHARYPVVMAVGMSVNTMFCYTAVLVMGFTWQEALVSVFTSGLLFMVLTFTGIRGRILSCIPPGVKVGVTAGIGFFIMMIGIRNVGILDPSSYVESSTLLAIFCIVITLLMVWRKVPAAILIGIIVSAVIGALIGVVDLPSSMVSIPEAPPLGAFLDGISLDLLSAEFVVLVLSFLFMELFDGSSQLLAVSRRAGKEDDGPDFRRAMTVDSVMVPISGIVGSSPAISIVESITAIETGARTGLTSVVYAVLLGAALFVSPFFGAVGFECVIGAMVIIGLMMMKDLLSLERDDIPSIVSVVVMIVSMTVLNSIAFGLALGVIAYVLTSVVSGRGGEVHRAMYALSVVFVAYLAIYVTMFRCNPRCHGPTAL